MIPIILTMVVIIVLALAVAGVVAVGMRGKLVQADPRLRHGFAQVARHLNGDADAPRALVELARGAQHGG